MLYENGLLVQFKKEKKKNEHQEKEKIWDPGLDPSTLEVLDKITVDLHFFRLYFKIVYLSVIAVLKCHLFIQCRY
jgi:hypothetical protein